MEGPQEGTKNFRAEILEIISLVFWKKLSFHKDIIKSTDLYPDVMNKAETISVSSVAPAYEHMTVRQNLDNLPFFNQ